MNALLEKYFGVIRSFLPAKEEETSLGLDIGAYSCRLVRVKREENSFKLLNYFLEPIVKGDVPAALKKILSNVDVANKPLYSSILGKGTLIRFIEMPRMTIEELRSSFSVEAEKYFPFNLEQIYTDCNIINTESKEKRMPVIAASAKKELVDNRLELLSQLGCQGDFVGFNILALANILKITQFDVFKQSSTFVVLDLEENVSSLLITNDRIPSFTRDIFVGGKDFKKRLSDALELNPQEAEDLVKTPGDRKEEVVTACDAAVVNIIRELRMSFDYFTAEGNTEVKEIFLFGESSNLAGLAEAIERNLEVKIYRWNPLEDIRIAEELSSEEFVDNAYQLAVALGLAITHYD